jgi:hypothetical protein
MPDMSSISRATLHEPATTAALMANLLDDHRSNILEAFKLDPKFLDLVPVSDETFGKETVAEQVRAMERFIEKTGDVRSAIVARYARAIAQAESVLASMGDPQSAGSVEERRVRADSLEKMKSVLEEALSKARESGGQEARVALIQRQIAEVEGALGALVVDREGLIGDVIARLSLEHAGIDEHDPLTYDPVNVFSKHLYEVCYERQVYGDTRSVREKLFCVGKELTHLRQIRDVAQEGPALLLKCAKLYEDLLRNHLSEKDVDEESRPEGETTPASLFERRKKRLLEFPDINFFCSSAMLEDMRREVCSRIVRHENLQFVTSILYGRPGAGKTAILTGLAEQLGMDFKAFSVPQMDTIHIGGIPAVDDKTGTAHMTLVESVAACVNRPSTVLLDEFLRRGVEGVKNQMHRFLLNNAIGEHYAHPLTFKVAATNTPDDNPALIDDIDSALANRASHQVLGGKSDESMRKLRNGWIAWVRNRYAASLSDKGPVSAIVAYLSGEQNLGQNFLSEPQEDVYTRPAYPTPRSWEAVIRRFASRKLDMRTLSDTDIQETMMRLVGPATTDSFLTFYEAYRSLPSINELIKRASGLRFGEAILTYDSQISLDAKGEFAFDFSQKAQGLLLKNRFVTAESPEKISRVFRSIWNLGSTGGAGIESPAIQHVVRHEIMNRFLGHLESRALSMTEPLDGNFMADLLKLVCLFPYRSAQNAMMTQIVDRLVLGMESSRATELLRLRGVCYRTPGKPDQVRCLNDGGKSAEAPGEEVESRLKLWIPIDMLNRNSERFARLYMSYEDLRRESTEAPKEMPLGIASR